MADSTYTQGNEMMEILYHIVSEIDEEFADRFEIERFKDLRIKLMEFIPIVQIKSRG